MPVCYTQFKAVKIILGLMAAVTVALAASLPLRADTTFYTNETDFRAAITSLGFEWFSEGFEGPEWIVSRYPGTAANVYSQGVFWAGDDKLATLSESWARTGNYGVFNTLGYGDGDPAPDDVIDVGAPGLVAIGGWFAGIGTLGFDLNDGHSSPGTLVLTRPAYQFAGVIDPTGLPYGVALYAGQFGADDFTLALAPRRKPRLQVTDFSSARGPTIRIEGSPGRANVIETSGDLKVWTPIRTNMMPNTVCPVCPSVLFLDVSGINDAHRFYRCFELP